MPNWCSNHLSVSGPTKALETFMEKAKAITLERIEDSATGQVSVSLHAAPFSLHSLVPRPDDLEGSNAMSSPFKEEKAKRVQWRKEQAKETPMGHWAKMPKKEFDAELKRLEAECKKGDENLKKYGARDWYAWSVANWGTKWDVTDEGQEWTGSAEIGQLDLYFDSAWAPPTNALEKIATMFTDLEFCLDYCEPGVGFQGTWSTNGVDDPTDHQEDSPNDKDGHCPVHGEHDWLGEE